MPQDTPAPSEVKACVKCRESKPLTEFYRHSRGRLRSECKKCTCAAAGQRDAAKRAVVGRSRRPKQWASKPVVDGRKECRSCSERKPVSEFYKNGQRYRPDCKACVCKGLKEQYGGSSAVRAALAARNADYYRRNRESALAYAKEARSRLDPERERQRNRERARQPAAREYQRQWRLANIESHRERARISAARRRAADPEPAREVTRRAAAKRRARLRNLPVEPYTVTEILDRDGDACVLCGSQLDLTAQHPDPTSVTVEHLECLSWPDSAGDVPSNVALAHYRCNCQRGDRPHPAAVRKRAELMAIAM